MRFVALILTLCCAGAAALPWTTIREETLRGYETPEGIATAVLMALLLFFLVKGWRRKNLPAMTLLAGGLSAFTAGLFFVIRHTLLREAVWPPEDAPQFTFTDSLGLMLSALTAAILAFTGWWVHRRQEAFSVKQNSTASFIANRVAFQAGRTPGSRQSFSRFIIRLSMVATTISVLVMVVTLALANGFQETVSQKVFSFLGHLRIQEKQPEKSIISEETTIRKDDSLVSLIRQYPLVERIHPFATRYALLKTKEDMEGVMIKGVDSSFDFPRFSRFIIKGRPLKYDDSVFNKEVLLSDYTARQLRLNVNDRLLLYFIKPGESTEDGSPAIRAYRLTVCGIYKTGIEEYDRTFALGDLRLLQRLRYDTLDPQAWREEIGGYEVFLHDYRDIDQAVTELYELPGFPPTWDTVSVKAISPNIFDWLNMQDVTRDVLIAFMIIVAVINLITCLLILVLERIRMIGILKALGATDSAIQQIFLRYALWIAGAGVLAGTGLALLLLWIQESTGFIQLPEEAYYVSKAAVKIIWWQVGAIGLFTLLICFLVLLIPSLLVRRVQPVKAIRFN